MKKGWGVLWVCFLTQNLIFSWLDTRNLIQMPQKRYLVPFEILKSIHRVLANVTEDLQEICSLLQQQLVAIQDTPRPVRWQGFQPRVPLC